MEGFCLGLMRKRTRTRGWALALVTAQPAPVVRLLVAPFARLTRPRFMSSISM